ncbi:HPr(Ser) kinase/phosphatase [Bacillus horti]|uniref:HPr kinase/phosphorylase n=1 Tax=Caldalkalibacillus horti TaxID=77523 RepID=A0ABT9W5A5_9BACI|nr:HPr(Ser) kinase/phosphatase [Bacillus horti]MDQ0168432.1 HPr kinase/phosphorylase [Bacillus horti]
MSPIKVREIVNPLKFEVLVGEEGLGRSIKTSDISRPGIELSGYFTYYPANRVQLLGKTELSFFSGLAASVKKDRMVRLCRDETPCICISRGMEAPKELLEAAASFQIPVLRSPLPTTQLISKLTNFLESKLAPSTTMHGVLVDIYGVGVLITGNSGIGKSETALEIVKRGHRLVADDNVIIRQTAENILIGNPPEIIRHLLEIRGVGIINVMTLFGAGAVRNFKKVSVVCRLENWDQNKQYDRLGLDEETIKVIDTKVPLITIPVRPGRNLAVIIEVAAMNFRLKRMGFNAAESFEQRLKETIMNDENEDF